MSTLLDMASFSWDIAWTVEAWRLSNFNNIFTVGGIDKSTIGSEQHTRYILSRKNPLFGDTKVMSVLSSN